jgi:ATP-binding cassette subfamily A (ABC1) protein 1
MAKEASYPHDVATLSLKVHNHPLPQKSSKKEDAYDMMSIPACLLFAIAFSDYPASLVVLLVKERQPEHNSKQQLVSGVHLVAFGGRGIYSYTSSQVARR